MKNYIYPIFILMLSIGCESYLDVTPKDIVSPERFYASEADGLAGITGLYYNLMSDQGFGGNTADDYFALTTDLTTPSRVLGGRLFFGYRWDENDTRVRTIWSTFYSNINDANVFIDRISKSQLDEDFRNDLIAEAVFIKGFTYHYLTAMFGDVPYITKATNDNESFDENTTSPRVPAQEIRLMVIEELNAVLDDLPSNPRSDYPQRATKWAVQALKLDLYLWLEDYQSAVTTALDIRDNSGYRLLENYADIFDPNNEFNDEIIFQFDYLFNEFPTTRNSKYQPRTQDENRSNGPLPSYFDGFNNHTVFKSFWNLYAENDTRKTSNAYNVLPNGTQLNYAYLIKQWRIDEARANSGLNYKFNRFADVLLKLSEAENELNGPTSLAYSGINQVRERAGVSLLSGLSQEELRDAIKLERSLELIGEGTYRKMDLTRWGDTEEALKQRLLLEQNEPEPNQTHINNLQFTLENYASYKNILPIPNDEIRLNSNLTQNEGY